MAVDTATRSTVDFCSRDTTLHIRLFKDSSVNPSGGSEPSVYFPRRNKDVSANHDITPPDQLESGLSVLPLRQTHAELAQADCQAAISNGTDRSRKGCHVHSGLDTATLSASCTGTNPPLICNRLLETPIHVLSTLSFAVVERGTSPPLIEDAGGTNDQGKVSSTRP